MSLSYKELSQRQDQGFPEKERESLLSLPGVGPSVIRRLEQVGYSRISELRHTDPKEIVLRISELMGSTCWRNSPQAKKAIESIVELADSGN